MTHATLDHWIRHEAIPFSVDLSETGNAAIDKVIASLGDSVELLGFGEALHGGEDILMFRNRLFQRLVETHGYSAIAIESSFPRSHAVNEYVAGRGPASYEAVQDTGFSNRFGQLEANRELVAWMRQYNADPSHPVKLRFYGFDMPLLAAYYASPSQVLHFVLDYLALMDSASEQERRQRIDELLGPDFDWENPAAIADPTQSVGLSPAATALRIETEDIITELRIRRPELTAKSDPDRYSEALHYAVAARQLLNYHAGVARKSNADVFTFASPAQLFAVLTPKRWEMVERLQALGPVSLRGLARALERDVKRVHEDAAVLIEWGLVERTKDRKVCVPFDVIHADFDLRAAA